MPSKREGLIDIDVRACDEAVQRVADQIPQEFWRELRQQIKHACQAHTLEDAQPILLMDALHADIENVVSTDLSSADEPLHISSKKEPEEAAKNLLWTDTGGQPDKRLPLANNEITEGPFD